VHQPSDGLQAFLLLALLDHPCCGFAMCQTPLYVICLAETADGTVSAPSSEARMLLRLLSTGGPNKFVTQELVQLMMSSSKGVALTVIELISQLCGNSHDEMELVRVVVYEVANVVIIQTAHILNLMTIACMV